MFQSTPPHGRRHQLQKIHQQNINVSIHASAREATMDMGKEKLLLLVSIHASAREATGSKLASMPRTQGFNPRLRTGGDLDQRRLIDQTILFQSTPPHGRRRNFSNSCSALPCFNPRLRTGGDKLSPNQLKAKCGFNPRLRTGGDQSVES